jgi:hypothetical protein
MNDDYYVTANHTSSYGTGGKVYLFKRSDGTLAYTVTNTNEDAFGYKFHIAGDWLAVTQTTSSSGSSSNRRILMYDISNFTTSTPATISSAPDYTLEDPSWGDSAYNSATFGTGWFSMSNEYVIASDYQALYPGTSGTQQWGYGCGIVYIWKIANFGSDTTPAHDWHILPPIASGGSTVLSGANSLGELAFGYPNAVKGDHLIVGSAQHLSSSNTNGGAFFQYDLSQLTSSVAQADGDDAYVRYVGNPYPGLYSTDGNPPDYFAKGYGQFQIDGDNLLKGSYNTEALSINDSNSGTYGMALIYDLTDGSIKHTIEGPFAASANRLYLRFGYVSSIDGDNVYIGTFDKVNSSGNPSSTGDADHSLYHYDLSNLPTATVSGKPGLVAAGQTYVERIFVERQYLDDHASYQVFGYGGELIVGAGNEDATDGSGGSTAAAGVCYVYE